MFMIPVNTGIAYTVVIIAFLIFFSISKLKRIIYAERQIITKTPTER